MGDDAYSFLIENITYKNYENCTVLFCHASEMIGLCS